MTRKTIICIVTAIAVVAAAVAWMALSENSKIPSERKMARILADVYHVDAIFQTKGELYSSNKKKDRTTENAYHTVLQHYDITKADFDSAIVWYAARPEKYAKVYDMVVSILSKREGDYKILLNKRDSINNIIKQKNDSIRVTYLKRKRMVHVPVEARDSVKEKNLKFIYDLDSIHGGIITANMSYQFLRKNEAKAPANMRLIVVYNDTIADTTNVSLIYSHVNKRAEVEYAVRDTLKAVKLKVNLIDTDDFKKALATISEVSVTYMPYVITDSVKFDEILLPPLFTY